MPEQEELKPVLVKQLELHQGEDRSCYNHPTTATLGSVGGCKVTNSLDLHDLDAITIPKAPRNGWPKISLHTSTALTSEDMAVTTKREGQGETDRKIMGRGQAQGTKKS